MTNIMKPGEGYFVEPSVSSINLKTFGRFQPLTMPGSIADANWYMKLDISDNKSENNLFLSIMNSETSSKTVQAEKFKGHLIPPRIQKGLYSFIEGSDNLKYCTSIKESSDGASWEVILSNDLQDDNVFLTPIIKGDLPSAYTLVVLDEAAKKIIDGKRLSFNIQKDGLYRLKIIVGTESYIKQILSESGAQFPTEFSLLQNYPNPFNPSTKIKYAVPYINRDPVQVRLKVYDILGNELTTLVNRKEFPGVYEITFNGNKYASGVYFYRIIAGSYIAVKKMILLK
jgi:hypothetical protein